MFKTLVLMLVLVMVTSPVAAKDYMTQQELIAQLKLGKTTPTAIGMIYVRVCEVREKEPKDGRYRTYGRKTSTARMQLEAKALAKSLNRSGDGVWEAYCTGEWQLNSSRLRHLLRQAQIPLPNFKGEFANLSEHQKDLVRLCAATLRGGYHENCVR